MMYNIGTVNGKKVNWSDKTHIVTVYGESIMIVGADSKEKALDMCKRNLLNFKKAE